MMIWAGVGWRGRERGGRGWRQLEGAGLTQRCFSFYRAFLQRLFRAVGPGARERRVSTVLKRHSEAKPYKFRVKIGVLNGVTVIIDFVLSILVTV